MIDAWTDSDLMGSWADLYEDHEEMQACESNPDVGSALRVSVPSMTGGQPEHVR